MEQKDIEKFQAEAQACAEPLGRIKIEMGRVIAGQDQLIDRLLLALVADGHVLLEGVPGLAKTLAVKTLAQTLSGTFSRLQFTPDLLPADVIGTRIYNAETHEFSTRIGPVFANIVLADEINRAPAKVQSALLEAMQEKQVTIAGECYKLPKPFLVMATQNPIEQEGTYPLPEAQLDRFMFLIRLTYPERDQEIAILRETTGNGRPAPQPVLNAEQLIYLQRCVREIPVSDHVIAYCADLARMSRPENPEAPAFIRENLSYGAGPRAGQYLLLAARAAAALEGRLNVSCADVRRFAPEVLRHRIACNFHAVGENLTSDMIVEQLIVQNQK